MDKYFVGDEYKRNVLEVMSPEQLIDVVLCHPTVEMRPSFRDTGFTASYRFDPLTNMQFTRDQQITTNQGRKLVHSFTPHHNRSSCELTA